MKHEWLAPGEGPNFTRWTCCAVCGCVQRRDGRPESECRGPVKVTLRENGVANPRPETPALTTQRAKGQVAVPRFEPWRYKWAHDHPGRPAAKRLRYGVFAAGWV